MANTKCSSCGSEEVIRNVKIVDHGYMDSKYDLAIELHGKPDALIFKDTRKGVLSATVCGQCGKVELSVDNPRELWEIYKRHEGV
jgi:formate dehydrogenase assembly factor FdhD